VSGTINSATSYSVSGSTSINKSVSVFGYDVARIRGTFALTLSSSGFSGSVTGAVLEVRLIDLLGNPYWQQIASGTAAINSNGTGSVGGVRFSY
jgi:hypothetical protein